MTKVKEVFKSIQGEGLYIGYEQVFVRFCRCNLNCNYCDTDFLSDGNTKDFSSKELADIINSITGIHSVSLTGGEPLLEIDFLKEFLPLCKHKIYLETNATLADNLSQIIDYVDYVSADIKLESATGNKNNFGLHDKFFDVAKRKDLFAKVVFNKNIAQYEIDETVKLAKKYNIQLVLQPQMKGDSFVDKSEDIERVFKIFAEKYSKSRLIPQMHKFLKVQ